MGDKADGRSGTGGARTGDQVDGRLYRYAVGWASDRTGERSGGRVAKRVGERTDDRAGDRIEHDPYT